MRTPVLRKLFFPLLCRVIAGAIFLSCASPLRSMAQANQPSDAPLARLYKVYNDAQQRYFTETNNLQAAWEFSRACFDIAYDIPSNSKRADFASQGVAAAQRAVAEDRACVEAHYYLGMNLGQVADARHSFSGLHIVKEMEREFLAAAELDEHFDYAGPDRNLGLLYENAPSIISLGSRSKARRYLEKALELAPDFPENYLNLIEAYLKWDYRNEAARAFANLKKMWPQAQKQLTGEQYAVDWMDWNKRYAAVRKKLDSNPKVNGSPHSAQ